MSDQTATEHDKVRGIPEVLDHIYVWSATGAAPAAGTAFAVPPLIAPFNLNVLRVWLFAGTAPANTSGNPPVALSINLQRTKVADGTTQLLYNEGATNAPVSTTLSANAAAAGALSVASNQNFPGPGGIPFGVVAQGGTTGGTGVPGSAGYPGAPAPSFLVQVDNELVVVTSGQGTPQWSGNRGAFASTAATHTSGATVSYINRPSILSGQSTNVLTTGVSPNLTPFLWNSPENPFVAEGDQLIPISKLIGTATGGSAITLQVHYQKA